MKQINIRLKLLCGDDSDLWDHFEWFWQVDYESLVVCYTNLAFEKQTRICGPVTSASGMLIFGSQTFSLRVSFGSICLIYANQYSIQPEYFFTRSCLCESDCRLESSYDGYKIKIKTHRRSKWGLWAKIETGSHSNAICLRDQ